MEVVMWSVIDYVNSTIRVRHAKGAIVSFSVNANDSLEHLGLRFDQGDARRAAITYLANLRAKK
jgi:hypothetical protein